ncbi:ydjO [Escherichia coli]|nr:ydjO [Escherichia coli]SRY69195.1 ydjO [Escherichia coli]
MMSLWDALRMNMMISYQELVRTFLCETAVYSERRWVMIKGGGYSG